MSTGDPAQPVIITNKARCRDCYRCVRVCPVKAIRMQDGQAQVVESRCISCGTCIRECPQGAKSYRNDLEWTIALLRPGTKVAASVAPSLAAAYPDWQRRRLPSALRRLGFDYVGETAIGAYHVACQTAALCHAEPGRSHIATACPAVVRYVERYRPGLIENLVPIVSPMLAHARHIKERLGADTRVVFIGPCVAKKAEAQWSDTAGLVDAVLTFAELNEWLDREGVRLDACEESDFDEAPAGDARLFPLEGGAVRTAGWMADMLSGDVVAVSGFADVQAVLDGLAGAETPEGPGIVEPLFCPQGCINGPVMPDSRSVVARRRDVLAFGACPKPLDIVVASPADLAAHYRAAEDDERPISEEEIRRVLELTGKPRPEDQLDCGACGYPSCREKAIAVIRGLAEPEMCIPRMKRLAEQRVDRIIETSPNGIVILDEHLKILHMNPAFRRFFMCSDAVCGQPISYLMDPEPFERLASGREELIESTVEHKRYNLACHQIMYPLREEKQYVGILVNITHSRASQEKLDLIRAQTVLQARELLNHQVQMAETIARFLGESTARGEDLVERLMLLADNEADPSQKKSGQWLRDMYSAK